MKIKEFLKSIRGLSFNTQKNYEQTLYQFHRSFTGNEPTPEDIKDFLRHYNTSSLQRHKAAIKAYWEWRELARTKENPQEKPLPWPFGKHEFPIMKQRIPRYFPPARFDELLGTIEDKDSSMALKSLFQLGARISELRGIIPENISPAGVTVIGKGNKEALIPITPEFYAELAEYVSKKKGKVFPYPYAYYNKLIKKAGAAIDIKKISLHMMRHSRAVDLLNKKMPLAFVQQFLRHSNINTTAIYLEITGGELGDQLKAADSKAQDPSKADLMKEIERLKKLVAEKEAAGAIPRG
jgi:site-specific recombinase XerD